ncbi:ThiF family adenylyltransferase [Amycolatopsis sp. La24]|uniref:ThiF family adenylyltransferase n=1 Tax=Amycolatopsis sp. La24 TaxID=3028304 RepID=UPI0023B0C4E2|nr:ThiF family adenylyltransferase [Amycolatopsis sp. La24]
MSQRLISLDPGLKRLRDEGYDIAIIAGYLVINHVPYATPCREVAAGTLACAITVFGDLVQPPADHTMRFVGEQPCTSDGAPHSKIINSDGSFTETITPDLVARYSFSSKPPSGQYSDFYEKVTTYVAILGTEAHALDPSATAKVFRPCLNDGSDDSVFHYIDTASSRTGINAVSRKLLGQRIAIVGLGGTGSYILDLVAKTWVKEIHLFDGDKLQQHNAFRTPGAISKDELEEAHSKVDFLTSVYSKLRTGIISHEYAVDETNVHELAGMNFVFLSMTDGNAKKLIVTALEENGTPFIDCGVGLYRVDDMLAGQIRTTTSAPGHRELARTHVPFSDGEPDEYDQNIQIAEVNCFNATMAVLKWKKLNGVYLDLEREFNSVYVLDGNTMINNVEESDAGNDHP